MGRKGGRRQHYRDREDAKARADPFINDEDEEEDENDDAEDEEEGPPVINPYRTLGLEKDASSDQVKKAYRKLALKCHPDKAQEDEKDAAHKEFQEIAFAYAVLSDDRRRKRYDLTGSTAEVLDDDDEFDWLKFYRQQFEDAINEESIDNLSKEYKGSAEERQDLLKAYNKHKGQFWGIYATVMLSNVLEDDDRFRQILDEEIAKGTIESYRAYEVENNDETRNKFKESERKRRAEFDRKQAQKGGTSKQPARSKKGEVDDMAGLAAMIQRKQRSGGGASFFDQLEAKYAPKAKGKKKRQVVDEPPEEAFQAMAARSKKAKKKVQDEEEEEIVLDADEEDDIGDDDEERSDQGEEEAPRNKKKRGMPQNGRGRKRAKA